MTLPQHILDVYVVYCCATPSPVVCRLRDLQRPGIAWEFVYIYMHACPFYLLTQVRTMILNRLKIWTLDWPLDCPIVAHLRSSYSRSFLVIQVNICDEILKQHTVCKPFYFTYEQIYRKSSFVGLGTVSLSNRTRALPYGIIRIRVIIPSL